MFWLNFKNSLIVHKRVGVKYDEENCSCGAGSVGRCFLYKRSKRPFGEYAEVVGYSVRDGSAAGMLPRADLFAISTDAYGSAEEEARHVPIDSQIMSIEVTFLLGNPKKLFEIPQGTKVLFVNVTSNMARGLLPS